MRTKRANKDTSEQAKVENQVVVRPRLVKATELEARAAAEAEAERQREQQKQERPIVVRTPRNAVEARDVFNSLFAA